VRRVKPRALLIDFNGVVQGYDRPYEVEPRYGLESGAFFAAGMEHSRYLPAVTGQWTRARWLDAIAEATGAPREALTEWDSYRGFIDQEVLGFVREVRASGKPVGLASNATADIRDDLALFGLENEFDAVFASAEMGLYKPTREFFAAACEALSVPAMECLFVDDSERNVMGARAAGLPAIRWTGPSELPYLRAIMQAGAESPA
jgi:putative hydrolase of the HAD superfamily